MISGLNQEVEILGKVFHFQTELSDLGIESEMAIRTEVFVGGKIVATRESKLGLRADQVDTDDVRRQMKDQHRGTLETFIERAKRYRRRSHDAPPPPEQPPTLPDISAVDATFAPPPSARSETPEPAASSFDAAPSVAVSSTANEPVANEPPPMPFSLSDGDDPPTDPPTIERRIGLAPSPISVTPSLSREIRVRQFFGVFRQRVWLGPTVPADLIDRLHHAAETLEWMISSPLFPQIRIDEQVQCNMLKEQIDQWRKAGSDPDGAKLLWREVITFNDYLNEVNQRSSLAAYDQQIIVWAIEELEQRQGLTESILQQLGTIYGRHPHLDRLLDQPLDTPVGTWIGHLRSLLTLI